MPPPVRLAAPPPPSCINVPFYRQIQRHGWRPECRQGGDPGKRQAPPRWHARRCRTYPAPAGHLAPGPSRARCCLMLHEVHTGCCFGCVIVPRHMLPSIARRVLLCVVCMQVPRCDCLPALPACMQQGAACSQGCLSKGSRQQLPSVAASSVCILAGSPPWHALGMRPLAPPRKQPETRCDGAHSILATWQGSLGRDETRIARAARAGWDLP